MTGLQFDPDNGGAIGRTLRWAFGRSYRTTLLGLLSLASTVVTAVAAMQNAPGPVVKWAPVIGQALMAVGLMITKDAQVSGDNRIPGDTSGPTAPAPTPPELLPQNANAPQKKDDPK